LNWCLLDRTHSFFVVGSKGHRQKKLQWQVIHWRFGSELIHPIERVKIGIPCTGGYLVWSLILETI